MIIEQMDGGVRVSGVEFIPRHTFECGQAFRWEAGADGDAGVYTGIAHGRVLQVRCLENGVFLSPCTLEEFDTLWRSYFDLDRDYAALVRCLQDDIPFQRAYRASTGLRLLRQQPWEALISFILSANNHIPRIKSLVAKISVRYGAQLDQLGHHAFPTSEALAQATTDELRALGLGYRAQYVANTAKAVAQGFDLAAPAYLPIEDARKHLMQLSGIGPKVADCVLLFGYARLEAFPVDVWVQRVLQTHYGAKDMTPAQLRAQASRFGMAAGYAQQVLFYYEREYGKEGAGA